MAVLKDGDRIIECRLGPEWNDQAKKLNKDDCVNMQGRISNNQNGSQLYRLDCEFTASEMANFKLAGRSWPLPSSCRSPRGSPSSTRKSGRPRWARSATSSTASSR